MDESADPDLPRGIALAWGIAADPQRGPKREMSVEKIVDAAVEIADAEGLAAVSMAAVAARLGYTPMSLYRYVSAKDDLVLLMQETATGIPPESVREEDGWRARLRAICLAQVQVFLAHPWILDIPITGSPATPNSAAWMDASLESLADTPLTEVERLAIALLVAGHSRWYGTILAVYATQSRLTGRTPDEITAFENSTFERLISADEFPSLRRAVDAGVFLSEADPFQFGIDRTLDGIGSYIAALEQNAPHDAPAGWLGDPDDGDLVADKRVRETRRAVRDAEKLLRDARKAQRQAERDARERLRRVRSDG
ncbi:MAG: TetR/AcrR family transcriptional regulator C-terminal domain-containing protein [Microbacterium sp.]